MKKSNNIDKIFKNQFNGAEITPPEDIWKNISSQLPLEKRSKRIIPLWYYFGGAAAALLIIALLLKIGSNDPNKPEVSNSDEPVIEDNNSNIEMNELLHGKNPSYKVHNENTLVESSSSDSITTQNESSSSQANKPDKRNLENNVEENSVINSTVASISKKQKSQKRLDQNIIIRSKGILSGDDEKLSTILNQLNLN